MAEETSTEKSETQISEDPQKTATVETTTGETPEPSIEELRVQIARYEAAKKVANEEDKKRRLENNALKEQLKELQAFKEAFDAEKLTEKEKQDVARAKLEKQLADLQAERDTALSQMRDLRINQVALSQAAKMNIVDPDVAVQLIKTEIDTDDQGNPTNVDDLLKALIKSKPYLVARQSTQTSGGATNPPRSVTSSDETAPITWEYIKAIQANPQAFNALSRARQRQITQWMNDPKNYQQRI